jgi:hypothetical protein
MPFDAAVADPTATPPPKAAPATTTPPRMTVTIRVRIRLGFAGAIAVVGPSGVCSIGWSFMTVSFDLRPRLSQGGLGTN